MTTISTTADELTTSVRDHYARTALSVLESAEPTAACCDDGCCDGTDARWGATLYDVSDRASLPDAAVLASLGCGNPTAVADLQEGDRVLDLGSGGGIDVLLSGQRVGPTGRAFGLDMTDEMLALAQRNAADAGATNVEFLKGRIEAIPLPAGSIDVVISNCVINLSADKPAVLAEMARVLRPGGRIGISDVVADDALDPDERARARQLRRLHRRRALVRRVSARPRGGRLRRRRRDPDACRGRRDVVGHHHRRPGLIRPSVAPRLSADPRHRGSVERAALDADHPTPSRSRRRTVASRRTVKAASSSPASRTIRTEAGLMERH